ncbi:pantothenate synthetase [Aulographum hederae CBS 113979]|uniref:Pantoate--beta-alanine ligase n=1 Tax=Aulographum hederae CBS 113979 TaxID=1176131 RepID=A0A6G1GVU4_9PEZI|nr:pantothenate synthetase [Aulographum hederae CBS 113979]
MASKLRGFASQTHLRKTIAFPRPSDLPSIVKRLSSTSSPPFEIFREPSPLRTHRHAALLSSRSVALVPTMGALHDGHLSLVRQAASENPEVIVSIYVNPTQFGVNEDLATYPKTWESDIAQLSALNEEMKQNGLQGKITAVFAPTTGIMYPTLPPSSEIPGVGSFVTITPLASLLEGASRPVFFRGVATVCMKLFNLVQPDRVYFGQKDVQQTVVIKRMVEDFHLPIDVRIGPTTREKDGLAMSSRNVYLGARRRKVGLVLSRALKAAEEQWVKGNFKRGDILWPANALADEWAREQDEIPAKERARFEVDYISLADPNSLEEIEEIDPARGAVLSGAIKMMPVEEGQPGEDCGLGGGTGPVRLIDNIILRPR